jgi:hypothetical protein
MDEAGITTLGVSPGLRVPAHTAVWSSSTPPRFESRKRIHPEGQSCGHSRSALDSLLSKHRGPCSLGLQCDSVKETGFSEWCSVDAAHQSRALGPLFLNLVQAATPDTRATKSSAVARRTPPASPRLIAQGFSGLQCRTGQRTGFSDWCRVDAAPIPGGTSGALVPHCGSSTSTRCLRHVRVCSAFESWLSTNPPPRVLRCLPPPFWNRLQLNPGLAPQTARARCVRRGSAAERCPIKARLQAECATG